VWAQDDEKGISKRFISKMEVSEQKMWLRLGLRKFVTNQ